MTGRNKKHSGDMFDQLSQRYPESFRSSPIRENQPPSLAKNNRVEMQSTGAHSAVSDGDPFAHGDVDSEMVRALCVATESLNLNADNHGDENDNLIDNKYYDTTSDDKNRAAPTAPTSPSPTLQPAAIKKLNVANGQEVMTTTNGGTGSLAGHSYSIKGVTKDHNVNSPSFVPRYVPANVPISPEPAQSCQNAEKPALDPKAQDFVPTKPKMAFIHTRFGVFPEHMFVEMSLLPHQRSKAYREEMGPYVQYWQRLVEAKGLQELHAEVMAHPQSYNSRFQDLMAVRR
ncbi:hypothetical protein E8E14_006871 [Neopestalotiopsis sp. 37M]|nr:hypothetical protein E8E14_006871 [Neopestalotiopsis sp. 37M]